MAGPPYIPFYPKDFLADEKVQVMDHIEGWSYILLLCYAWSSNPPASIPNDDQILSKLTKLSLAQFRKRKAIILAPFELRGERFFQKRLEAEYKKFEEKCEKARLSAGKRWNSDDANAMPTHSEGNALQNQNQNQNQKEEEEKNKSIKHLLSESDKSDRVNDSGASLFSEGEFPDSKQPPIPEVIRYLKSKGYPESDAQSVVAGWKNNGFTIKNGKPIKSWRGNIDLKIHHKWLPSQQTKNGAPFAKKQRGSVI